MLTIVFLFVCYVSLFIELGIRAIEDYILLLNSDVIESGVHHH